MRAGAQQWGGALANQRDLVLLPHRQVPLVSLRGLPSPPASSEALTATMSLNQFSTV